MLEIIFYVLTISYLTRIFSLGHRGPFESFSSTVYWRDENNKEFTIGVSLFDRVKRYFGAYEINDYIWVVRNPNLWLCPYCLSFRINLILLVPFILLTNESTVLFILMIFGVPAATGWMNSE